MTDHSTPQDSTPQDSNTAGGLFGGGGHVGGGATGATRAAAHTGPDTDTAIVAARSAQLYYRYARAVDDHDHEALRAMVTDDVKMTRADGTREGVEAFLDVYRAFTAQGIPSSKHGVTNILATRAAAGEIHTQAYFEASMFGVESTRVIVGHYDDIHVERDGRLLLAHKIITVDRVLTLPAAEASYVNVGSTAAADGADA